MFRVQEVCFHFCCVDGASCCVHRVNVALAHTLSSFSKRVDSPVGSTVWTSPAHHADGCCTVTLPLPSHWMFIWACLATWAYTSILWQWQYTSSSSFCTSSSSSFRTVPFSPLPPLLSLSAFSLAAATGYNLFQICEVWGFTVLMLRIQRPVFIGFCASSWVFFSPYFSWLTNESDVSQKSRHWYCHYASLPCCNEVYDM